MGMGESETDWFRHANPWSVWTRMATFPLTALALYSWVWLGIYAIVPLIFVGIWTWLNPRIFPKPASTKTWASKVVFGEKLYLDHTRYNLDIAHHHVIAANITTAIAGIGALVLLIGVVFAHPYMTILGTVISFLGKLWFVDRMAWLFDDIAREDERFATWLYE